MKPNSTGRAVLISGASVAGLIAAHWLHRYGFTVTVVEQAPTIRLGGYPIDIRGTAVEVVSRTGIYERVNEAHVDTRLMTFYNNEGKRVAAVRPEAVSGGVEGRDLEVPRGALTNAIADVTLGDVEIIYGDSIETLNSTAQGVEVTLRSGAQRSVDVVIGSDGLHSNTRQLAFAREPQYERYLGYCFAGFTLPNELGMSHEGRMCNVPGKSAVLYCAGDSATVHGLLVFHSAEPPAGYHADREVQQRLVEEIFSGIGWETAYLVDAMRSADDVFFDVVSQVHMPLWAKQRVVLTGDSAHAPSFFSGQGTSLALVSAYVLAGELAATTDHQHAFQSYEQRVRSFVQKNQALAAGGQVAVTPATSLQLWARNQALRIAPLLMRTGIAGRKARNAHSALTLPQYEPATATPE